MKKYFLIFILMICYIGYGSAKIIHIPSDYSSIQDATNNSNNGDTLLVQPGTYYENIDFHGKRITLASLFIIHRDTTYISKTIIDGNKNNSVLTFKSGEDTNSVVIGFTIQNGYWMNDTIGFGTGIYCKNSGPKLVQLAVKDNQGFDAGAIFCENSELFLENVTLKNNKGLSYGESEVGGIYCINSSLYCKNVKIQNNEADLIGGIYSKKSNLHFSNVDITQNEGLNECGGIKCCNQSLLKFENTNISNNNSFMGPGGILCEDSKIVFKGVEISDNISNSKVGGGLFSNSEAELNICSIHHNSGNEGSGLRMVNSEINLFRVSIYANTTLNSSALDCFDSKVNVINCTLFKNSGGSPANSGGMFIWGGKPIIINSIFWDNSPKQIGIFPNSSVNSSFLIAFSDIKNGRQGVANPSNRPFDWLEGNISFNPEFVNPQTYDISLSATSPCIDAGTSFLIFNNDTLLNLSSSDYSGSAPDIGSKEFVTTPVLIEKTTKLPKSFELNQNFPNPFRNQTAINFQIPFPGKPIIEIYDIIGRKVNEFHLGNLSPGHYSIIWNGKDYLGNFVTNGAYIIKITFSNTTKSIKTIYMK